MKNIINRNRQLIFTIIIGINCLFLQAATMQAQVAQSPVSLGVLNRKAKMLVTPAFPAGASKSGAVKVNVTIDKAGNVLTAEAVEGDGVLREPAVAAARKSKFTPYLVKGKAVKTSGFLVFNFTAPPRQANTFSELLEILNEPKNGDLSVKKIAENIPGDSAQTANSKDDFAALLSRCGISAGAGGKSSDDYEAALKVCTEGIERFKNREGVTNFYYYRGLAEYLRVRQVSFNESQSGKFKPFAEFLPKFLASASEPDFERAFDAASDFNTGLALDAAADMYKKGHLYEAEMFSLLALKKPSDISRIKDDSRGYAAKALEEFAKAEKTSDKKEIEETRSAFNAEMNKLNSAADAQTRYKQLSNEYYVANEAFTKSVQNFQAALKTQQASSAPSPVPVCEALTEMNTNFQKSSITLAKITEMKNKGELSFLPAETLNQLTNSEAQAPSTKAKINGAAANFGCKLN